MNSHVDFLHSSILRQKATELFLKKSFPRMKVTLPSKVASKQASKILIERQMVLLRAWLPKLKKKKVERKEWCYWSWLQSYLMTTNTFVLLQVLTAWRADAATILTSHIRSPWIATPPKYNLSVPSPTKQHTHALTWFWLTAPRRKWTIALKSSYLGKDPQGKLLFFSQLPVTFLFLISLFLLLLLPVTKGP